MLKMRQRNPPEIFRIAFGFVAVKCSSTHTTQTLSRSIASAALPAPHGSDPAGEQNKGIAPATRGHGLYVLIAPIPHTVRRKHG